MNFARLVSQVLGHPGIIADFDGRIVLIVSGILETAILNVWVQVFPVFFKRRGLAAGIE
jgi:hypothetical protein